MKLKGNISLSNKPIMTFSKEHQTAVCRFDALSRAKVTLPLGSTLAIFNLLGWLLSNLRINYVGY